VQLPRPRRLDDACVGELHDRLLAQYPDLLSGLVESDSPPDLDVTDPAVQPFKPLETVR
jgi:hypothetical protein